MTTRELTLFHVLTFGKYEGYTIEEIIEDDPDYIEWAIDEIDWFKLDQKAIDRFNDKQGYGNKYMDSLWGDDIP